MKKISVLADIHFFILLSCSICNSTLNAETPSPIIIQLWLQSNDSTVIYERALPSSGDSVLRITDITTPCLTVYRFRNIEQPTPAVLIFPGGGYQYLAINKEGADVAKWFNSIGITAVVVKYSVPDNREAAFRDGQRAIRLVRYHARKWNIDPNRIGIIGFSAGGHLSARLSTDFKDRIYVSIDSADTEECKPDFCILMYPAYLMNKQTKKLADELPVTAEIPPTLIVQTKDDTSFVDGTIVYNQALKKAGVPVTFHLFSEGGHGYGIWPSDYEVSYWPKLCEKWLKEIRIVSKNFK